MKYYLLYILTALFNAWFILFLLGISAGFGSYVPVVSLFSSVLLFILAAPAVIYWFRIGLFIGLGCCLLILPYNLLVTEGLIEDLVIGRYGIWGILMPVIPTCLTILSLIKTFIAIRRRLVRLPIPSNGILRAVLFFLPIGLFIAYIASIWKYLSWKS